MYVFAGPSFTFLRESWALSDDPLVRESRQAVVQVFIDSRSGAAGRQWRGSGFNISQEGLVVTNRHLVQDASIIRVSFPGRGTFMGQKWHTSPYVDLAVIEIDGADLPAVPLAQKPPQPGEELLVIGNPLQFARVANRGVLIDYRVNPGRDFPHLVVEAAIYPGSSGSPLFNDWGEVVGVVFATLRNADPREVRGLAVDVRELDLFLNDLP